MLTRAGMIVTGGTMGRRGWQEGLQATRERFWTGKDRTEGQMDLRWVGSMLVVHAISKPPLLGWAALHILLR